jgi:hypothetical protein
LVCIAASYHKANELGMNRRISDSSASRHRSDCDRLVLIYLV